VRDTADTGPQAVTSNDGPQKPVRRRWRSTARIRAAPLPFPTYPRDAWMADAVIHVIGLALAPLGAIVVARAVPDDATWGTVTAVIVYVVSLWGMLAASAAYNMAPPGRFKAVMRRVDHAMIFVAIAGTYTPFLVLRLSDGIGPMLCAAVWGLALIGAARCLTVERRSGIGSTIIYVALGWIGLPVLPALIEALHPEALTLIIGGGLLFTTGSVIHRMERLRYHNPIWHVFVLTGAICHFAAVRIEVVG